MASSHEWFGIGSMFALEYWEYYLEARRRCQATWGSQPSAIPPPPRPPPRLLPPAMKPRMPVKTVPSLAPVAQPLPVGLVKKAPRRTVALTLQPKLRQPSIPPAEQKPRSAERRQKDTTGFEPRPAMRRRMENIGFEPRRAKRRRKENIGFEPRPAKRRRKHRRKRRRLESSRGSGGSVGSPEVYYSPMPKRRAASRRQIETTTTTSRGGGGRGRSGRQISGIAPRGSVVHEMMPKGGFEPRPIFHGAFGFV